MNIRETLLSITDKSIEYITQLIMDSDIAENKEEIYTALGAVAVLINAFVKKNLGHSVMIIEKKQDKGE